jgi:hypothetical protein
MMPTFLSVAWGGFPWARGSGLILVDALFPLDGGKRREGKKLLKRKEK